MDKIGTFTVKETGALFTVNTKDLYCYRGIEQGTAIYMIDGLEVRVEESFEEVDRVLDFLTPVGRRFENGR